MKYAIILGILLLTGCAVTGNVVQEGDFVTIPISDVSEKETFYEFNDAGIKINYFAVMGSDGVPRTAFDACDVCGGYKGYRQQGNDIVCKNCGRVFDIDGLGTENKGFGCWPSYLPHSIKGEDLLTNVEDLRAGRHRFA